MNHNSNIDWNKRYRRSGDRLWAMLNCDAPKAMIQGRGAGIARMFLSGSVASYLGLNQVRTEEKLAASRLAQMGMGQNTYFQAPQKYDARRFRALLRGRRRNRAAGQTVMKATIRYTTYDGYRIGEPAIVRVTEITHCVPLRGNTSLICLTNGKTLHAVESIDELEQRIDEAERELQFSE